MFYTLTVFDGFEDLVPHKSREEAEAFAHDAASDGNDCHVLGQLCIVRGVERKPVPLEKLYGVRTGVDFPATLTRSAS